MTILHNQNGIPEDSSLNHIKMQNLTCLELPLTEIIIKLAQVITLPLNISVYNK